MNPQAVIPLGEGFLLGIGLIVGIGPQNAFILQQGVRRRFVFTVALLASLIDGVLIALGVTGVGRFFWRTPLLMHVVALAGVAFLFAYGCKAFKAALQPPAPSAPSPVHQGELCRRGVVCAVLAVSLFNPLAYLDTLLVIGGSAARWEGALSLFFAAGAAAASTSWFFTLAFGAAGLGRCLQKPITLRLTDTFSGAVMWLIGGRLMVHTLI